MSVFHWTVIKLITKKFLQILYSETRFWFKFNSYQLNAMHLET